MRRGIIAVFVFLLLLVLPTAARYGQYYSWGTAERTPPPAYDPAAVVQSVATPPSSQFVDEPETGDGVVLLDVAHNNLFDLDDIASLNGRLSARGMRVQSFSGGDLARTLRAVNAFVIIAPTMDFTDAEVQAVTQFVNRGGRVMLVGDPTRFNVSFDETDPFATSVTVETDEIPLNTVATAFDITFLGDYLYNTQENEGNFRNIILNEDGFGESALTAGLETVVFYGAHSLRVGPTAKVLLAGDDRTWSSATDRPGGLTLAATSRDERVLAVSDLHFMNEPYFTVYDNGRFIAQIADFLAESSREYTLADFPYLFADEVDLVYTDAPDLGAGAFGTIIPLQDGFRGIGKELTLTGTAVANKDTLQLGLYNQSQSVSDILERNGITLLIDPPIVDEDETKMDGGEDAPAEEDIEETEETAEESEDTAVDEEEDDAETDPAVEEEVEVVRIVQSDLGNIEMSGMALILLDETGNNANVIVLAASTAGLDNTISRLLSLIPLDAEYALAECLVQENLALCPTNIADEEVGLELITSSVTVTSDDETEEVDSEDEMEVDTPTIELDAAIQGNIGLGETVEGELGTAEKQGWVFAEGPAIIDVTLQPSAEMDVVLELYGTNNELISSSDQSFTSDAETLLAIEIPDDGEYTIVVREFFDVAGPYSLTVEGEPFEPNEEEEEEEEIGASDLNIFYFTDDDGDPIEDGFTSVDALTPFLSAYEVQFWSSTVDGPLAEDTMADADFIIWDSGDYQDAEGFLGDDVGIIFTYLEQGIPIFFNGSSPTILGEIELASLSDLEIVSNDPILTNGYEAGEIIVLEEAHDVAMADFLVEDADDTAVPFMLRGAGSEATGNIIAVASIDEFNNDQQSVILMLPFVLLPEAAQTLFFENMIAWFGF